MKLACFGAGYVGLVSSACFANAGHHVMCVDTNADKIRLLQEGVLPIYESGLDAIVETTTKSGNLLFTADPEKAIEYADLLFIAVGTPPDEDGSADLQYVLAVAAQIGQLMARPKVIVTKSTVPVGSADRIRLVVQQELDKRKSDLRFDVASNPEFLKEGSAVADFMKPDRFIVGTGSEEVRRLMQELYDPFNWKSDRMIFMDIRAAELTKYAANAMLATKISFMNEIANLAELLGTDIEQVRQGIGSDSRIGYHFIYPGIGYGGSCFPKDVRALSQTASKLGRQMRILNAVEVVNTSQKSRLVELILRHYTSVGASPAGDQMNAQDKPGSPAGQAPTGRDSVGASPAGDARPARTSDQSPAGQAPTGAFSPIKGKTFALWGLSFKPKTDDMREAPSRVVMEALWEAGAAVQAYDPEAMDEVERIYGHREDLRLVGTRDAALLGADALIICTEWQHFRAADFDNLVQQLADKVIFDGRNLYEPARVKAKGLSYYGIGRGESVRQGG